MNKIKYSKSANALIESAPLFFLLFFLSRSITMKTLSLSLLTGVLASFVMASFAYAAGPDGKITKRAFHYNNYKFWRAGSVNAPKIGSYGKKKTSTGIDIHDTISSKHISKKVKRSGTYSINFKSLKRSKINIDNFEYADVQGSGSIKRARQKNAQLKLIHLTIDNGPLINALNKDKKALEFLKKGSSRVVSSIWVVVSAKVAEMISTSGNLSIGYKSDRINVSGSVGGSSKTTSITSIPTGAVFAYMVDKVKTWKKKRLKKVAIKTLEDDQVGLR